MSLFLVNQAFSSALARIDQTLFLRGARVTSPTLTERRKTQMKKKVKPISKVGQKKTPGKTEVFCRYITRNGKRIYHPTGEVFHFFV